METHQWKPMVFSAQFKQVRVARVEPRELPVAELALELAVAPQLVRQRLSSARSTVAVTATCPKVMSSVSW